MSSWDEAYSAAADRLAVAVLGLLLEPEEWIQRRVETITVSSQALLRRAVTVDLVLPVDTEPLRLLPGDPDSPIVIPLGLLRKEPLIDFDLTEGSSRLMLVRSGLNARVAAALMAAVARNEGRTEEEVREARPWFRRIAGADLDAAQAAFSELYGCGGAGVPPQVRPVNQGPFTRALAEQLRDSYMLLVELPDAPRRRVVRFATDQVLDRKATRKRSRLGLVPSPLTLEIPGATQACSYHVQVSVPSGCQLSSIEVHDEDGRVPTAVHEIGARATAYPKRQLVGEPLLHVGVVQERGFYFLPAAVISGLVALVLAAGATVAWTGGTPLPTASAIMLAGLSAITGLVIRRDEAPLTTELHALARGLLIGVTIAALAAAGSIALGATGDTLATLWTCCAAASVLGATILAMGAIRSSAPQNLTKA